jgi:uncharacterized protein
MRDLNSHQTFRIRTLAGRYRVCRLGSGDAVPAWALQPGLLTSITRTADELSIVAPEEAVRTQGRSEGPLAALTIVGPLDFGLVGVLARLTSVLAAASIAVFVVSTFDTDIIMLPQARLEDAQRRLVEAGYELLD